ncbi:MAG: 50S ribosomal protein L11 methyltransferase [Desulfomonilaceae bacterium]
MKKLSKWRSSERWWTSGIVPVDVGENLRLVPYWETHKSSPTRQNLIIDPGASFGAGNHPTTIIALELLEKAINSLVKSSRNVSLFDIGTGTGVLSIAAKILGCDFVVACDLDPCSIHLAQRNTDLNSNSYDKRRFEIAYFVGEINAAASAFDIVIANLAAPVLVRLKQDLICRSGSYLILSGIPDSMVDLVEKTFLNSGMCEEQTFSLNEWNGFIFKSC